MDSGFQIRCTGVTLHCWAPWDLESPFRTLLKKNSLGICPLSKVFEQSAMQVCLVLCGGRCPCPLLSVWAATLEGGHPPPTDTHTLTAPTAIKTFRQKHKDPSEDDVAVASFGLFEKPGKQEVLGIRMRHDAK